MRWIEAVSDWKTTSILVRRMGVNLSRSGFLRQLGNGVTQRRGPLIGAQSAVPARADAAMDAKLGLKSADRGRGRPTLDQKHTLR